MIYYIYKLVDPITTDVRYIGKTKLDINKRLHQHCLNILANFVNLHNLMLYNL